LPFPLAEGLPLDVEAPVDFGATDLPLLGSFDLEGCLAFPFEPVLGFD